MYNITFEDTTTKIGTYLIIENNKIYFESKEDAYTFLIQLLKDTGRVGY